MAASSILLDPRITGRGTVILFATFAIVVTLALVGTFLSYIWKVDTGLISQAMNIVGLSGPTGTAIQSGAEVYGKIKMKTPATIAPQIPEKVASDPRWQKN